MRRLFFGLPFLARIFILQLLVIFACALGSFKNLTWWDGEWYAHIINHGYSATLSADPTVHDKGNVGFFPGYPLAGWIVQKILSGGGDAFPAIYALLIVSFIFAFLTWVYLAKWLALHKDLYARPKMILFALYPFTLFLYVAYSEAIYTAFVLGFFYFTECFLLKQADLAMDENSRPPRDSLPYSASFYFFLALVHGLLMNSTRLLGVVFVIYPLIRAFQLQRARIPAVFLWWGSYLGTASFFLYCEFKFHAWNFYFITEEAIWGTKVDWKAVFPPSELFNFARPLRADTTGKYVTLAIGVYLTYRLCELLKSRRFREPLLALVLVCGMFWGEHIFGRAAWKFAGMGRMMIPVITLMLPYYSMKPSLTRKWFFIGLIFMALQIAYALKFARYGWVA